MESEEGNSDRKQELEPFRLRIDPLGLSHGYIQRLRWSFTNWGPSSAVVQSQGDCTLCPSRRERRWRPQEQKIYLLPFVTSFLCCASSLSLTVLTPALQGFLITKGLLIPRHTSDSPSPSSSLHFTDLCRLTPSSSAGLAVTPTPGPLKVVLSAKSTLVGSLIPATPL